MLAPRLNETPVRVLLGLLLVLFLPGYSLVAALFPRKDDLDGIERIALSFGLSIAVVPLIGLALNYTPLGIRLVPVLLGLSLFTVLLALVAYIRRAWVSKAERFMVEGWGLGCGGDGSGGGRSGSGGEGRGEGRGGWAGVSGSGVIVTVVHDYVSGDGAFGRAGGCG